MLFATGIPAIQPRKLRFISAAQTLTNKTLVSPVITTPTGILTTDLSDFVSAVTGITVTNATNAINALNSTSLANLIGGLSGKFLIKALQEQLPLPR